MYKGPPLPWQHQNRISGHMTPLGRLTKTSQTQRWTPTLTLTNSDDRLKGA
jgi:hypothetical protein